MSFGVEVKIAKERERLHQYAARWGFNDERTLKQSEKVDKLVNAFMIYGKHCPIPAGKQAK